MSKISKELIESYRKIVLPFVSNRLCKADFEGQGEIDKTEFEQDFNEILNLALSSLNPQGDAISREALREKAETITLWNGDVRRFVSYETIDNAPTVKPCENCDLYFKAMTKEEMRKGGADNEHL